MHLKNIKAIVRKQLKSYYRNWKRLSKKDKKLIAKKVLDEVVKDYDFSKEIKTAKHELLGIEEQLLTPGIMDLDEMARFIDDHENNVLIKLNRNKRHPFHIKDEELRFIDNLLEDRIINDLLSYDKYCPGKRDLFPSNFLRAELLKAVKYPEISYRKFCGDDKAYKGTKKAVATLVWRTSKIELS